MENTHIQHNMTDNVNARLEGVTQRLTTDHESIKQSMSAPSLFYETLQIVKYEDMESDDENALNTSDEESDFDVDSYTSTCSIGAVSETHTKLPIKDISDFEAVNSTCSNTKTANIKTHNCVKCDKHFKTKSSLKRHFTSCKGNEWKKKHECDVCHKVFRYKSTLRDHYSIHTGDRPYTCSQCSHATHTLILLKDHIRNKHEAHYYQCSVCDKHLKSRFYYKRHLDSHKGVRFPCYKCDKTFSAKITLNAHLKLHDGEMTEEGPILNRKTGTLLCEVCHKQFTHPRNLALHMQVHLGTQKFSCSECDIQFSRNSDLKRHEFIHSGDKPFKCLDCDMSFRHPGSLSQHKSLKHDKNQTCPICDRTFARKSEYKRHVLSHENGADLLTGPIYQCSICKLVLQSEYNLQTHTRSCGQLKSKSLIEKHAHCDVPCDLCCDKCDMTFSSLSNKNRHSSRRHTQKTFTCDICSKTFKEKSSLKGHIQCVHLKQLPYPCTLCERQFYKKIELNRHKDKKH